MLDQLLTPESLLHPVAAAVVAEVLTLWIERFLKEWRWTPLLTLVLCVLVQAATALATGLALSPLLAWRAAWFGFLGASVAVFGREIVLNAAGLLNKGPRDDIMSTTLGSMYHNEDTWNRRAIRSIRAAEESREREEFERLGGPAAF